MLMSANTFSPSSQPMLVSKGNMFSSVHDIEVDARVQLLSRCTRARLHALVHYFTHDLNLMLADITRQAFVKCLLATLIREQ